MARNNTTVKTFFDATTCYGWAYDVEANNNVTPSNQRNTTNLWPGTITATEVRRKYESSQ